MNRNRLGRKWRCIAPGGMCLHTSLEKLDLARLAKRILTVAGNVRSYLCECVAYSCIGVEQIVVFVRIPLGQGGELLGDGEK